MTYLSVFKLSNSKVKENNYKLPCSLAKVSLNVFHLHKFKPRSRLAGLSVPYNSANKYLLPHGKMSAKRTQLQALKS